MSKVFKLVINCDNAAFEDDPVAEIKEILKKAMQTLEREPDNPCYRTMFDTNGNDVGRFRLKDER